MILMLPVRTIVMVGSATLFVMGLMPPDRYWLMGLGLAGFIGACFIPKDV